MMFTLWDVLHVYTIEYMSCMAGWYNKRLNRSSSLSPINYKTNWMTFMTILSLFGYLRAPSIYLFVQLRINDYNMIYDLIYYLNLCFYKLLDMIITYMWIVYGCISNFPNLIV